MLTDLAGPIIYKLGSNYVNVTQETKREKEKQLSEEKGIKRKRQTAKIVKTSKVETYNSLYQKSYIRKFISKSLYEKVYIKVYKNLLQ